MAKITILRVLNANPVVIPMLIHGLIGFIADRIVTIVYEIPMAKFDKKEILSPNPILCGTLFL